MQLVLVGGGHAHLIVLEQLAKQPTPALNITLITPSPWQYYSGMLPGWIMGKYNDDDCRVDLRPLTAQPRVQLIQSSVVDMNADERFLSLNNGQRIEYDLLSLDTGSKTNIDWQENLSERLLTVKPIEQFCHEWRNATTDLSERVRTDIVIVGGGAAGAELSIAIKTAQSASGHACALTLITGDSGLLPGHNLAVQKRMRKALYASGVTLIIGRATGVSGGVILSNGTMIKANTVIAATGARPSEFLAKSGLTLNKNGFVAVDRFHKSVSHNNVFAAGDVSARVDNTTTRSGVHAVRAGPILIHNLLATTKGLPLRPYAPKKRSLYLLVSGPNKAILSWGRLSAIGEWVWNLKDKIDRNFIKRFSQD